MEINQLHDYGTTKRREERCNCRQIKIETSEVIRILISGQIPVFTIERLPDDRKTVRLDVTPMEAGTSYLAVSHAWTANPLANQLPTCQLK